MPDITLGTDVLVGALVVIFMIEMVAFQLWTWHYSERTLIDLNKGLNSFKSMPATVKKQLKHAIKEELEDIDWSDILPDMDQNAGMLSTIMNNLGDVVGAIDYFRKMGDSGKGLVETGLEIGSKVVKEVVKEDKE